MFFFFWGSQCLLFFLKKKKLWQGRGYHDCHCPTMGAALVLEKDIPINQFENRYDLHRSKRCCIPSSIQFKRFEFISFDRERTREDLIEASFPSHHDAAVAAPEGYQMLVPRIPPHR